MRRTRLSCPTVIESLSRLEDLGLVVSTTHERGKVKTYYVADPPATTRTCRRVTERRGHELSRPARGERRVPIGPREGDRRPWTPSSSASSTTCSGPSRSRPRRLGDQGLPGHRALLRFRHGLGLPQHPDDRPPGRAEPADRARRDRRAGPGGCWPPASRRADRRPTRSSARRPRRPRPGQEGQGARRSPTTDRARFFRGDPPNCPRFFRGAPPKRAQNLSRRWPSASAREAPRLGPNENQEREKTPPASRSRERRSASRPRAGCLLLWICRNC